MSVNVSGAALRRPHLRRGARRPCPRDAAPAAAARRPGPGRPRRGPTGIVRLDPGSAVSARAPPPLARSMYDVDVRLSEMDEVGVPPRVSLPPFLFASTAEDEKLATDVVAGQRRSRDLRRRRARPAAGARLGAARLARRRRGGRALDDLGMAGIAIGSRGGRVTSTTPSTTTCGRCPNAARSSSCTSGVPDPQRQKDFWLPQLVGYPMETALAVARLVFGRVLERC